MKDETVIETKTLETPLESDQYELEVEENGEYEIEITEYIEDYSEETDIEDENS